MTSDDELVRWCSLESGDAAIMLQEIVPAVGSRPGTRSSATACG